MAEQFLTLMADLDEESQMIMGQWYDKLKAAGFVGEQTPHATIILDEPETICRALPEVMKVFRPFYGHIVRLHLCAFWPTREIATVELTGTK